MPGIIKGIFASSAISDFRHPTAWLVDCLGSRRTQSGQAVTPVTAMTLSVYYACLQCVSEDVGKLPFKVYKRIGRRDKEPQPQHPVNRLMQEAPNEEQIPMTFRETMTHWAMGWGNGYAEIARDSFGNPRALYLIHPSRVTTKRDSDGKIIYSVHNEGRAPTEISALNVLHIRGLGNDLEGYSVVRYASESLGLGLAAQSYGARFFGNNATPSIVLEHPGELGEEAAESLRKSWHKIYGDENQRGVAIIEEGMKANTMAIPNEESQFLETRNFQVVDICRWFRVPPHKIQHLERATFSNIEHQATEYVTDTLFSWFKRWEQEVKRKLFMPGEEDLFAEHVVLGLLRGDSAARANYFKTQFMNGSMSQNDIRAAENMNSIGPAGDVYYVPLNMVPSEIAMKGPQEKTGGTVNDDTVNIETVKKSQARVFAAVVERYVQKEQKAVAHAANKKNRETFIAWCAGFYAQHAQDLLDAVTPIAESMMELLGSLIVPVPFCRAIVGNYVNLHHEAIQKTANVDDVLQSWVTDDPGRLAVEFTETLAKEAKR